MSGPDHETLTAALRRLADEHATGLLSVATDGADVVIELASGTPAAIGPVHDVHERVGEDAPDELVTAVVVDELVDRTVAAVVHGDAAWEWDVTSSGDLLPLPEGLAQELARRAVDAAQSLGTVGAEDVLVPAEDVEATGELDRVRHLFDGIRTVADVAEAADLSLPAVATMAAALVAGGALAHDDATDADDDEPTTSWSDTVAASDDEDGGHEADEDDEPELWVMVPTEDDAADDEQPEPVAATPTTEEEPSVAAPVRVTVDLDDAPPPADGDPDHPDDGGSEDGDITATANWNDTSWLDDLAPQDEDEGPPVLEVGGEGTDTRAALGSMLSELQQDGDEDDRPARRSPERPAATDEGGERPRRPAEPAERHEPKAEPGEVAEFLRELSRLALEDD